MSRKVSVSLFNNEKGILISLRIGFKKLSLSPDELGSVISALEKARNNLFGLSMISDYKTGEIIAPEKEEIVECLSIRY